MLRRRTHHDRVNLDRHELRWCEERLCAHLCGVCVRLESRDQVVREVAGQRTRAEPYAHDARAVARRRGWCKRTEAERGGEHHAQVLVAQHLWLGRGAVEVRQPLLDFAARGEAPPRPVLVHAHDFVPVHRGLGEQDAALRVGRFPCKASFGARVPDGLNTLSGTTPPCGWHIPRAQSASVIQGEVLAHLVRVLVASESARPGGDARRQAGRCPAEGDREKREHDCRLRAGAASAL
eukprot:scaffold16873_cov58-Phaeocystis_antarctica.AAC.2